MAGNPDDHAIIAPNDDQWSLMHFNLIALYGGPDQVMTVTYGIASIIGVLLIFWNKLVAAVFKLFGRSSKATPTATQQDPPTKPS